MATDLDSSHCHFAIKGVSVWMCVYSTVQLQKITVNGLESCVSIVTLLPLSGSCYMRGEALFLEPRGEPPERFRAVWELSPEGWKWFRAVRSVVFAVSSWPGQRRPEASQARHALFPVLGSISANTSGRMASAQVTKRIMNHRVWINNLKSKENRGKSNPFLGIHFRMLFFSSHVFALIDSLLPGRLQTSA